MSRRLSMLVVSGFVVFAGQALADDSGAPASRSKHQMMKDCMAKQQASDSGIPKSEMRKNCRDVVATKKENAQSEKDDSGAVPAASAPRQ